MFPAHGQLLSDSTGLVNRLDVQTEGRIFEIKTVSNFDITSFDFDKDEKKLTLYISSGLEDNLGEIIIPQNLLAGNFTFYLNDEEFNPKLHSNEKISFVTLNFTGSGNNKFEIFGTTYLNELTESSEILSKETVNESTGGGCLIATATYGSELAPQVQQLRELRDNTILSTESGAAFMAGFNQFYYSFSPYIADLEREQPVFKDAMKIVLTPMLSSFSLLNHVSIDSEHEMLGFGISLILLNIGMYVGIPAIIVTQFYKSTK